jgi:predicted acetyltransferase
MDASLDHGGYTPAPVASGDELEFVHSVHRNFYEDAGDEDSTRWVELVASDAYRAWVVRDADEVVANYGIHTMDISVPGGGRLPMAGITAVGVAQTHRRRGILTAMMAAGLDDAVERGEPVAALYASESPIYGRYGFGITAPSVAHVIDRGTAFHELVDPATVRAATPKEALSSWPAILDHVRDLRPGAPSRTDQWWRFTIEQDPPSWRDGFSAKRLVHVPDRGYAMYRVKDRFGDDGLPAGEVRVLELVAADREAEAALWQHVCDIDLTAKISAWYRPPDDPLLTSLVDPLRARTRVGPPLYARLLDVRAAFAARRYAAAGSVTFAVVDPTRDQSGTYHLDADVDGAEVARVDVDPELTLPIEAASSVWLGGMRATHLLDGGRVQQHVDGAAARFDRLLATERAPWGPFEF